jgi:polysaccharide export outer membrane protein
MSGCAIERLPQSSLKSSAVNSDGEYLYRLGTGDIVSIFVWGNPDISSDYSVRPDGKISMALTDALTASGKTTQELERALEEALSDYLLNPKVSVIVKNASGSLLEQVKIIGKAAEPVAMPYRQGMTLLDLMIRVGGLSPYADGNNATLIRITNNKSVEYPIRIEDLMVDGDLTENIDLKPGDIVRIPEAWF